jgi:hypothetical protein
LKKLTDLWGEPFVTFSADILGGEHMGDVTALRAQTSFGQFVCGQSTDVDELRRMIEIGLDIGFLHSIWPPP